MQSDTGHTSANEADINQAQHLLHGQEKVIFGDAGYTGMDKRPEVTAKVPDATFLVAAKPSKIKAMKKGRLKENDRSSGESKGLRKSFGGASFPNHQAPLWLHEGPV